MDNTLKTIGRRIRGLRRQLDMTQEELAEKADLSLKYIGELERGRGNPTITALERIAAALGTSLSLPFDVDHGRMNTDDLRRQIDLMLDDANGDELEMIYRITHIMIRS